MTKEEKEQLNLQLIDRIRKGDNNAYNEIIQANESLINQIIKRNFSSRVNNYNYDDFMQEARIGIINGVEAFIKDSNNNLFKLSTYLGNGIYYAIKRFIRSNKNNINFSKISLDMPINDCDDKAVFGTMIDDENALFEDSVLNAFDNKVEVDKIMDLLSKKFSPQQIEMFKELFLTTEEQTCDMVGKKFNMSRQNVSYTVKKMQSYIKKKLAYLNKQESKEKCEIEVEGVKELQKFILDELNKPEQVEIIKYIMRLRLTPLQQKVFNAMYFNGEKRPTPSAKIVKTFKFKIATLYHIRNVSIEKIKQALQHNTGNIIIDNLDNPDLLNRIQAIVNTRLMSLQQEVINRRYFDEDCPTPIKLDRQLGLRKGRASQVERAALLNIEKELANDEQSGDFIQQCLKDPKKAKLLNNIVRFAFTQSEKKGFYEFYENEDNKGLSLHEIIAKTGINNVYYNMILKVRDLFTNLNSYKVYPIPERLLQLFGVEEIDEQLFYEAFATLSNFYRQAVYEQYFLRTASNVYDPKCMTKLKEIYFTLLNEKQQAENE